MQPIDQAIDLVRARYAPKGNIHAEGKFISGSQVTSKTAADLYDCLVDGWDGNVPKYYSFLGNTLADEAFNIKDGWHHEAKVKVPLIGDWYETGSMDAIQAIDGKVVVGEHKSHGDTTAWNEEKAFRQGANYLSLAWKMVNEMGVRDFESAEWVEEDGTFQWPEGATPGGVVVAIAERNPPGIVWGKELSLEELQQIRDFYHSKALCIAEAVDAKDRSIAVKWDTDHPGEIGDKFLSMVTTPDGDPVEQLAINYREAFKLRKQFEADEKKYKALIEKTVKDAGLWDKVSDGGIEVAEGVVIKSHTRAGGRKVDYARLEADGLHSYITRGAPFEVTTIR